MSRLDLSTLERLQKEVLGNPELSSDLMTIKRGETLIREGQREDYIYLIEEGAVRAVYQDTAQTYTIRFGYKGSLINSMHSYFSGDPSELSIEALRTSQLRRIHFQVFEDFIARETWRKEAYLTLMKSLAIQQHEREIDLLIQDPSERLRRVMQRSAQLFQEVPLKYIASYLRMTPETLSRMLKKLD